MTAVQLSSSVAGPKQKVASSRATFCFGPATGEDNCIVVETFGKSSFSFESFSTRFSEPLVFPTAICLQAKSKLDWDCYKKTQGLSEELAQGTKDG